MNSVLRASLVVVLILGLSQIALGQKRKAADEGAQADADAAPASELFKPDQTVVFKTINDVKLRLHVFNPPGHLAGQNTPAIIYFFGGAFRIGKPSQFYGQCRYLASRGIVAISAEYRIQATHGTSPEVCVTDAKSAIRWARSHADELGIDPNRIAAGGGSAGGFLAAATATLPTYDEPDEDTSVSCKPNALVIYNGNFDRGPGSSTFEQVQKVLGDRWADFSPLHHIQAPFPPTVFMVGTQDKLISQAAAKKIESSIQGVGGRCDLHLYDGQPHGFFNYGRGDGKYYRLTLIETDRFLASLGYLNGEPTQQP